MRVSLLYKEKWVYFQAHRMSYTTKVDKITTKKNKMAQFSISPR